MGLKIMDKDEKKEETEVQPKKGIKKRTKVRDSQIKKWKKKWQNWVGEKWIQTPKSD